MASIDDLLNQISDESLRNRLKVEIAKLKKTKKFGLVFEEHLPEQTILPEVPIRIGSKVALKKVGLGEIYEVTSFNENNEVICVDSTNNTRVFKPSDLATVAEFGTPIYPYLKRKNAICNNPHSPVWHSLIESDNFHALQLLDYLYHGKVDCIYIDPPYNTGAKDWKYNNNYVDNNDAYRHSKWLSMMKKRLLLAKKLLNPNDSVLIVTIDEKEYLHLGCLLEELFPEARIQMVTTVISSKGVVRVGQFSRVEEYIYIVEFGKSQLVRGLYNMLDDEVKKKSGRKIEWLGFRRRAPQSTRDSRPNQFYPIFVRADNGRIVSIGNVVGKGIDRHTIPVPKDCIALWPLSKGGDERLWSLVPDQARANLSKGYIKLENWNSEKCTGTIKYLASGTIEDIESGKTKILGKNSDGSINAEYLDVGTTPPKRVWNVKAHNAETYGTNILNGIIGKRFDYPKSLYAVADVLRFYVSQKPHALIIDFFAGSGTTLHAVNLLNAEDGGERRCIMVTNNEVSEVEAKNLTKKGYQPGDKEWEKLGIAQYVTWPRTVCSIEGHDINNNPLKGTYLGSNLPMSDGFKANAIFFSLGFLDKTSVALGQQFRNLLPLLWMKAGAFGPCPDIDTLELPVQIVLPENNFAVLLDEKGFSGFEKEIQSQPEIQTIFLVTDFEKSFQAMSKRLNRKVSVQLYRDYLDNFRISQQIRE